jgi:hypothetical protein
MEARPRVASLDLELVKWGGGVAGVRTEERN